MDRYCCIIMTLLTGILGQSIKVCGPSENLQVNLSCSPTDWISVNSKQYSAPSSNDSSCAMTSDCLTVLSSHSHGLDVTCNGPAAHDGLCDEKLNALEILKNCNLGSSRAAVEVRYSCVAGRDVMNMCSNETHTWVPPFPGFDTPRAYLATPSFPNSPALSQNCTCVIAGKNLWLRGIEIKLDGGRADMLTVTVNGTVKWSAGQPTSHYVQEILLSPESSTNTYQLVQVSYRDYNLPGQRAWIEIKDVSQSNLTISCQVISIPPPPTTTMTAGTSSTSATTTLTVSTTEPSSISTVKTTMETIAALPVTASSKAPATATPPPVTTIAALPVTASSKAPATATPPPVTTVVKTVDKAAVVQKKENTGIIVGLVILAVILIIVAVVLMIVVRRRVRSLGKEDSDPYFGDGLSWGPLTCLCNWFHTHGGHSPGNSAGSEDTIPYPANDFHDMEKSQPQCEASQADKVKEKDSDDRSGQPVPRSWSGTVSSHSYETVGELDLRLKPAPSVAYYPAERTAPCMADGGDYGSVKLSAGADEKNQRNPHRRSTSSSEGKASSKTKDELRKERFVAKVLDEALRSVIQQREALTAAQEETTTTIPASTLPATTVPAATILAATQVSTVEFGTSKIP